MLRRRKNSQGNTGTANTSGLQESQSTATASTRKRKTYDALEYTRNRMGLRPAVETRPGTVDPELSWLPRLRLIFREPLLEFWGVLVMMLLGGSVTAVTYLSEYQFGNWLTICFGWSAAMIFGIYVAGDSGAYLNPAITLTNCLFRGLPLRRWPVYAVAQFLGAFCGHGLVYANYISAIDQYEGHGIRTVPPSPTTSAKIFCQFPQPFVPLGSQIFSEFIANFFMTFLILAVRDENGADLKGGGFFVIAFFWLNFVVMAAFGWETGSPINPARDLMGRTWLTILGYKNAWSAYNYYFWIPFFVPFFACFFGALTYDIFIYTGDSPINNGDWSLRNLREGTINTWNTILARFGRRSRGYQSDEENLAGKQDEVDAAGKGDSKPSQPSLRDNTSGKAIRGSESDAPEADPENTESSDDVNFTNTRKGGNHGEAWETEETPGRKESQKNRGHGKDNDYDNPVQNAAENHGDKVDSHGNETRV